MNDDEIVSHHTLPQADMYWSKDEDKGLNIVRETMSRNRFRAIKQSIHLSDNTQLNKDDKFSKLRPIFDTRNTTFLQFGVFDPNLSIDEEMVPYFGRHSCKMFIRGKPVRFGFKLWCLCSHDGYLYKFIPYGGKVQKNSGKYLSLKEKGFFDTGTVRDNRLANCPVETKKVMNKKQRGSYVSVFDPNLEVLVVQWNNNSVVTVTTNACSVLPLIQAKRYNRKQRKEEAVPQPNVISEYNKYMGGVDFTTMA